MATTLTSSRERINEVRVRLKGLIARHLKISGLVSVILVVIPLITAILTQCNRSEAPHPIPTVEKEPTQPTVNLVGECAVGMLVNDGEACSYPNYGHEFRATEARRAYWSASESTHVDVIARFWTERGAEHHFIAEYRVAESGWRISSLGEVSPLEVVEATPHDEVPGQPPTTSSDQGQHSSSDFTPSDQHDGEGLGTRTEDVSEDDSRPTAQGAEDGDSPQAQSQISRPTGEDQTGQAIPQVLDGSTAVRTSIPVRVAIRATSDGRLEFGIIDDSTGGLLLPDGRYLRLEVMSLSEWTYSSPVTIPSTYESDTESRSVEAVVRIAVRSSPDGKVEFGIQQQIGDAWSERLLPENRFLPPEPQVGMWLTSSQIIIVIPGSYTDEDHSRERLVPDQERAKSTLFLGSKDEPVQECNVAPETERGIPLRIDARLLDDGQMEFAVAYSSSDERAYPEDRKFSMSDLRHQQRLYTSIVTVAGVVADWQLTVFTRIALQYASERAVRIALQQYHDGSWTDPVWKTLFFPASLSHGQWLSSTEFCVLRTRAIWR